MKQLNVLLKSGFIVLLAVFLSCDRDPAEEPEPQAETEPAFLSIEDAYAFFSEYEDSFTLFPGAATRSPSDHSQYLDWSGVRYSTLVGYDVVEVPLVEVWTAFGEHGDPPGEYLEDGWEGELIPNATPRFISGLNSWGEIYYRMVYILPTDQFLCASGLESHELTLDDVKEGFSGMFLLRDTDGCFTKGYVYEEGTFTGVVYPHNAVDKSDDAVEKASHTGIATRSETCYILPVAQSTLVKYQEWDDEWNIERIVVSVYRWISYVRICETGGGGSANSGEGGDTGGGNTSNPSNPGDGPGHPGKEGEDKDLDNEDEDDDEKEVCEVCRQTPCKCCGVCLNFPCICCHVCGEYPCKCMEESDDPCKNLLKKLGDPGFMARLNILWDKVSGGEKKESAFTYDFSPGRGYEYSPMITGKENEGSVNIGTGGLPYITGFLHSHYAGEGMDMLFSFEDLLMGYHYYNEGVVRNLSSFSWGLVTPAGTYYLMIDDPGRYLNVVGRMYDSQGEKNMNYETYKFDYYEDLGVNRKSNTADNETALLDFLSKKNFGLTLMKYDKFQGVFGTLVLEEFKGNKISTTHFCSYN